MPLHPGPRLHALVHGLFRASDKTKVKRVHRNVEGHLRRHGLLDRSSRHAFEDEITNDVLILLGLDPENLHVPHLVRLIRRLLVYEELFELPEIDWQERRTIATWWQLRDTLSERLPASRDAPDAGWLVARVVADALDPVIAATALFGDPDEDALTVTTDLVHTLGDAGAVADRIITAFTDEDADRFSLFSRLIDRLERNTVAASGGDPANPQAFTRPLKLPSASGIRDNARLLETYFAGTPLLDFFDREADVPLPTVTRFEHHHIVAGSGHGKTQTLQYLIGNDLDAVAQGKRSVIVIDSQGDLIRTVSSLAAFAPGGSLHDRLVLIDPTDVEYPVSLNLFDVGIDRISSYEALEKERLTNSILELYDFVLGSLLEAEMTQKQSVIFRYVTRLMLRIPDATIHTLRELLEPDGAERFKEHISSLTGVSRAFFNTEFSSREFEQTKRQVVRRLWGILENRTFERMFSHPRSKLDLFTEMNAGNVILINTAKDLLKEQGSEIFGRFFIALIAQAAQERATIPEENRMPTFVYIDEAADYFDENIAVILSQARKYNVGMVLAHQYLSQLDAKLLDAFAANTAIKFAGGVSAKDARSLSSMLSCEPSFIEAQGKGSFAAHIRGRTARAIPLRFPFGFLEERPRMSDEDRVRVRAMMRKRYAVHYSKIERTEPTDEPEQPPTPEPRGRRRRRRSPRKPPDSTNDGTDASFDL